MAFTAYVNETLRVTAQDLTHSDTGAVTTGATVTVAVYNAAGVLQSTASTTTAGSGDDWWIDITAPATAGTYEIRVTAVKSGATWSTVETLTVLSLAIPSVTAYTTVATVKLRLDIGGSGDDAALESVIEAASRAIDGLCNRWFYQMTATTRHFTASSPTVLDVPDLVSVTSLTTDTDGDRVYEDTWAATDYDLEPYNAADVGEPYRQLMTTPAGLYGFPTVRKGVKITGTWGWPSVPDAIAEACALESIRLFKRKDAPYGIAGSSELGMQTFMPARVDPQVKALIAPYVRMSVGAV